jgi:Abnormal spindle-like microcephaly-assoc'd, ASPM-SPD-2-Hydin
LCWWLNSGTLRLMRRVVLLLFVFGCSSSSPKSVGDPCGGSITLNEGTLTVSPTIHAFGAVAVGSESPTKFVVTNIGCQTSGPIDHAIGGSSEFAIVASTCGPPLAYNSSCEVSVVFRPQTPGDKNGRLVVLNGHDTAFTAPLTGTGVAPDAGADAGSPADAADAASVEAAPADVAPDAEGEGGLSHDGDGFEEATLTVSPTAFSFTGIVGQSSAPKKFVVSNLGPGSTGPISHSIDSGDFVITASTCGQPLAPQGTCEVAVVFRPTSTGPKNGRLTLTANPGKTFSALLYGTAVGGDSSLQPPSYAFPTVAVGGVTAPLSFTLTNTSGTPAGPLSASLGGMSAADFAITGDSCSGSVIQPGGACSVSVRFQPTGVGDKVAQLILGTSAGMQVTAALSGTGVEGAKLVVTPTSQPFGDVPVGMKSSFGFAVTNDGGTTAGKLSFTLEGMNIAEFTAKADPGCDLPLAPATSCTVIVTFAPTSPGSKTATLRLSASPGGFVKAELSGTAISAGTGLTLSSASPDPFGTVTIGESSTGIFTVENKGSAATGKIMSSISGPTAEFVVVDNACPDHLDPGQQCAITVRFSPVFAGRRTAILQVNAQPGGFATLPLGGRGCEGSISAANCQ